MSKLVSAEKSLSMENVNFEFQIKVINRCRRFPGMPTILYCLHIIGTLYLLQLAVNFVVLLNMTSLSVKSCKDVCS